MDQKITGAQIRKTFIDFFLEHKHTFVPSMSLVPGDDATLLFTNAGMVQFKDVFLGTDVRSYVRAANSQKCMRVAGKHNDLEDVGQDDTHHTFFEMLGNWSFGDYYKKEAIVWAWQLLTDVWDLPKARLYATVFKDEKDKIPTDDEAARYWLEQPGFDPAHIFYLGRKENFWEMADTGPCGPCSEIHYDLRPEDGPVTAQTLDTDRFIELWNLVFIQYNRIDKDKLDPLPATHVDTGMGLDRLTAVLQGVDSNYKTDLFLPMIDSLRTMTGHSREEAFNDFTPYRVITDHARAAAFLIADGVVPGNTGRNYVCRMIIRRAARFGSKLDLNEPFLAKVAEAVVDTYGSFYPELNKNRQVIMESLTREEVRFARTVESGTAVLEGLLEDVRRSEHKVLDGEKAFDLYATFGLPLEITRDIAREQGLDVDDAGFRKAMEKHRQASGAGQAMGPMGGEDVEQFKQLLEQLQANGKLGSQGVRYDPYQQLTVRGEVLSLYTGGSFMDKVSIDDYVEIVVPETSFYIESGGQVSDTGTISAVPDENGHVQWSVDITGMRRPAAGMIVHMGYVAHGTPCLGDEAVVQVDIQRRRDIMRNHTATHLLHAALRAVLGEHVQQAGSLVAPDRLRFDFNHAEAMEVEQIERVEELVNREVYADLEISPQRKTRQEALDGGAIALFGEKYDEEVRTIAIGNQADKVSYELCGGTHLDHTGDIHLFLIVSEGSAAAGVRRIEAVTGSAAYSLAAKRMKHLRETASILKTAIDDVPHKAGRMQVDLLEARKQAASLNAAHALASFSEQLEQVEKVGDIHLLTLEVQNLDKDTLGKLADKFRQKYPSKGVCVIGSIVEERVVVMAAVTRDLVKDGLKAGDLVNHISQQLGACGGGAPHLAFGGGKDTEKVREAICGVKNWIAEATK